MINKHINEGNNVILDKTLKTMGNAEKLIKKLKDKGYEVHLLASLVDADVAIGRAHQRFKEIKRFMPYELIAKSSSKIKANVMKLRDKVDSYAFVDNNNNFAVGGEPFKVETV